jgi:hypothetical protein
VAALFRRATVDDFLSGYPFSAPGDFHDAAYLVAEALVAQLEGHAEWQAFVATADAADGGIAAAEEHLGLALPALVAATVTALSVGGFEPRPAEAVEQPSMEDFAAPAERAAPEAHPWRGILVIALVVAGYAALRGC